MFPVQALRSSQEIYIGARLLVALHDAGVGLCEAVSALEPIAESLWQLYREGEDADEFGRTAFRLRVDPSIHITAEVGPDDDGERECMGIHIRRLDRFFIQLWCHAHEDCDFVPFAKGDPTIGIEAEDVNELATFLTLTRTLGGEIDVDAQG